MTNSVYKSEYIMNLNPDRKVQASMDNTGFNFNGATSYTEVPFNTQVDILESGFLKDGNGFIALFDGWVDVNLSMLLVGAVTNGTPELAFAINGGARPVIGANTITNLNGSNRCTVTLIDGFNILRGQKITLLSRRSATNTGTIYCPSLSGRVGFLSRPIIYFGTGPAGIYTESFEGGLGNWSTPTDGGKVAMIRQTGQTPSNGTGPVNAQSGGYYMYCETSSGGTGAEFVLQSSYFRDIISVNFWYHAFGPGTGLLEFQWRNGTQDWTTVWSSIGDQGDIWKNATVNLQGLVVSEIRFRYTGSTTYQGDLALDNIRIESE